MKKSIFLLLLLLSATGMQAQLPSKFAVLAGGGVSFPYVKAYEYDYYAQHGNLPGYNLQAEGRYYFSNDGDIALGVGLQFDYINNNRQGDKLHTYFGHPEFIFRLALDDDQSNALFVNLGAGLMHYEEKMNPIPDAGNTYEKTYGHNFHRNYFAVGIGVGYEFSFAKGIGAVLRFDYSTAGIFWNKRARLIDIYDNKYDDAEHKWLKSNIQFFNFSIALEFGQ